MDKIEKAHRMPEMKTAIFEMKKKKKKLWMELTAH